MGIQERKERERERRRQQIMVAAKRVFLSKGFNKTTMEDIAKDAELSPGTLYLYFKNKDELYASLSLRILQYLQIRMEHINNEKGLEPPQQMNELKQAMYDVYEFDPLILINMFHLQSRETLTNLSDELLSEIKGLSQSFMASMAAIFKKCIDRGYIMDEPPKTLVNVVWALFSGIILWEENQKILNEDNDYLKHTFDSAFAIFLRGIVNETMPAEYGMA